MSSRRLSLLLTVCLSLALFAPVIYVMLTQPSDYVMHMRWALDMARAGRLDPRLPHFLFHAVTIVFARLMASHPSWNEIWIGAGLAALTFYTITTVAVWLILHVGDSAEDLFTTLSLLLIAPIFLWTWRVRNIYWGYITPNPFHNPTVIAARSMSIPLAWLVSKYLLTEGRPITKKLLGLVGVLTLLSGLAKPNYILCLLPALVIITTLLLLRKQPVNGRLLAAVVIPALALLAWQYQFAYSAGGNHIIWAPFLVVQHYSSDLALKLGMSALFPFCVLIFFFREVTKDFFVLLSWVSFGVGVFLFYALAESGRAEAGNFLWGADITLFVLFLASLRFLSSLPFQERDRVKRRACYGVYILHLVCGLMAYGLCLFRVQTT